MTKGRGLSALVESERGIPAADARIEGVLEVPVSRIYPNPDQPRKVFDENAMRDLTESIREHGVISPIVVNASSDGTYMIIAGERRYRAAVRAGLTAIPVVIKRLSRREMQEIALIENLQREDLNPIEAAYGMKRLIEDYALTQEELAARLGKSRPAVANTLRLLTLDERVIELVRDGRLSSGHARTLVPLPKDQQAELARECVRNGWSVRDAERAVKQRLHPPEVLAREKELRTAAANVELKLFVERARMAFGTKVSLIGTEKKGRIYIDYYTRDDLERISEILDILDRMK